MKRIIFPAICTLFLLYSCDIRKKDAHPKTSSTAVQKKVDSPTTALFIDTIYDFNKVKEGEFVTYNYRFKNTGKNPLVIYEALASCGCTVPEKPEHPIAPGEIGFIKVKFNSDHRPGEAHKSITITSNAQPEFPILILKGTVIGKTE